MKRLQLLLMIITSVLFSQQSVAQEPEGEQRFRPVVVLGTEGEAPDEVKTKLVQAATDIMREATLTVYSREIYGSGARFNKPKKTTGALGMIGKSFQEYDRRMEKAFQNELKPLLADLPQDSIELTAEILWVKADQQLPNSSNLVNTGHMFGLMWKLASMVLIQRNPNSEGGVKLVGDVLDMPVVNKSEVPGGIQSLYDQGRDAYNWLREGQNSVVWPLYIRFIMEANKTYLSSHFALYFKPADLSMKLDPPEPEDFMESEYLLHQPPYYGDDPPIGRVAFDRSFRTNRAGTKPTLTISFGKMAGKDVRALTSCLNTCAQEGRAGPVHVKKFAPTTPGKLRVPDKWRSGWSGRAFRKAIEKINQHLTLYVMLNNIVFDLSDRGGMRVIPEKSRVPMVIRFKGPLGGMKYYDITKNSYGFDYMEKLVASEAAKELTLAVRGKLKEGDAQTNRKFTGIVNRLSVLME